VLYPLLWRMKIDDNDDHSQRYGNGCTNGPEKRPLAPAHSHAQSECSTGEALDSRATSK
jgi:hypothetical protein